MPRRHRAGRHIPSPGFVGTFIHMPIVFLASFVIGLLLAVRAMLHGIERPAKVARSTGGTSAGAPVPAQSRFVINLPTNFFVVTV